jgi:nucleoside-diphosphate-sugar epimerase
VTGGSGFIGQLFVRCAIEASYQVQALIRSDKSAAILTKLGASPINGDLLIPGNWQQSATQADYIVHMAQPTTFGGRITKSRAERYRTERLQMEAALFQMLRPDTVKRIVYVGGTSYYGEQGSTLKDETIVPNPRGWGPYIVDALEALKTYVAKRLPIVEAFPGGVYGVGSWYPTVLETLYNRKRVVGLVGQSNNYTSSIHVEDCARAILHLLEDGEIGQRYFLVDDRPNTNHELVQRSAEALNVRFQTLLVPKFLLQLIVGPVIADALDYENRLSNAKLHNTGFQFNFPTIDQGIPNVVKTWLANL